RTARKAGPDPKPTEKLSSIIRFTAQTGGYHEKDMGMFGADGVIRRRRCTGLRLVWRTAFDRRRVWPGQAQIAVQLSGQRSRRPDVDGACEVLCQRSLFGRGLLCRSPTGKPDHGAADPVPADHRLGAFKSFSSPAL